jgi:hypothetical protein
VIEPSIPGVLRERASRQPNDKRCLLLGDADAGAEIGVQEMPSGAQHAPRR